VNAQKPAHSPHEKALCFGPSINKLLMNVRKFVAPNLAIIIVLSIFWFAGIEPVTKPKNDLRINVEKYAEVQEKIMDNYWADVNLNKLYKQSIVGLVSRLHTKRNSLKNTPLDTSVTDYHLSGLHESVAKFKKAYKYMANHYPHTNMSKNTVHAIRSMFHMLDPHSIYIPASEGQQITQRFNGKFQGIGIYFQIPRDTITVVSTIAGGPSAKVGIHSEDRIVAINDSSAVGFSIQDVRNALLGPKGTKVRVTIKRPHINHLLHFTITRAEIPIYTVDTSYMMDSETGYIRINRFAATTHKEFMQAVQKLKKKGMKRLMIDLRDNPGGYMRQAILLASEFFPKGTEILSTKSRFLRYTSSYDSPINGKLQNIPLIVLVSKGTASASEIFSGAIQDHDRGLIIGQRTYGKGLVQQQYTLVDSSKIRVTIARYYTPSGRLIQKPYIGGMPKYALQLRSHNAVQDVKNYFSRISKLPDSLMHHTDAGRIVYGGGGIVPDHIVQEDTSYTNVILNYIRMKGIGLDFARNYLDREGDHFKNKWKGNYTGFRKHFDLDRQALNDVLETLKKNQVVVSDTLSKQPVQVQNDTLFMSPAYYKKAGTKIRGLLKADIAQDIWGRKKFYPIINDQVYNKVINKAMSFWNQAHKFAEGDVSPKDQSLYLVKQQ
jgi:carboxyl-terminal processing protease